LYGLALFAGVGLIGFVVGLPASLYRTFRIEARFGFNKLTWPLWFADLAKGAALAVLIGGPLLLAVLWLMDAMGKYWWLYVWLVWLGTNLLVLLLYPTVIAPLFNKFTPLQDPSLKQRIEALLKRCGFATSGLFVMDGSKRSAHGNAYFTGFGRTKRIVFFDTLLEKLAPEEIEAVLAHELGHFPPPPRVQAHRALRRLEPGLSLAARTADRSAVVLRGPGSRRRQYGDGPAAVLHGAAGLPLSAGATDLGAVAPPRIRSGRLCRQTDRRHRSDRRAGQALSRQTPRP